MHKEEYIHLVPKPCSVLSRSLAHVYVVTEYLTTKGISFNRIPLNIDYLVITIDDTSYKYLCVCGQYVLTYSCFTN